VHTAVLVPVKAFSAAKKRLAPILPDAQRQALARWMADGVLAAAAPLAVFVACDNDEVASWAESRGASVLWGPGLGLNGAIDHGVETIAGKGYDHVIVAHGDLPLPSALASVPRSDTVVLVPDRRSDGTNVLSRPCRVHLPADYGGGSFERHLTAAFAAGVAVSVRRDPRLSIDIDTIADCRHPEVAAALARAGFEIPAGGR
jgi:2-phospho-L-lactate guanylyltransferase